MASMELTYIGQKFMYMPLFTLYVLEAYVTRHLVSPFSIQNDTVSVVCIDVPPSGRLEYPWTSLSSRMWGRVNWWTVESNTFNFKKEKFKLLAYKSYPIFIMLFFFRLACLLASKLCPISHGRSSL
jgi:hypothetical protein